MYCYIYYIQYTPLKCVKEIVLQDHKLSLRSTWQLVVVILLSCDITKSYCTLMKVLKIH